MSDRMANLKQKAKEWRESDKKAAPPEHNLIKKFLKHPTRQRAIAAKCFECYGGTKDLLPDHGYKNLIRTCTAPDCPLYIFRPYKEKA